MPDRTASTATDTDDPTADPRWPVVYSSTERFVWFCRAAAVVVLAYAVTIVLLAVTTLDASVWLWVAIAIGGLLHLAGVAGLWLLPRHCPSWRRPGHGSASARSRAVTALRTGADLDADDRRLVAEAVAVSARQPLLTAAVFALLGPVLAGTPNSAPLPWLGAATAGGVLLVLVAMSVLTAAARRRHRAAARADALPLVDDEHVPYLPR